METLVLVVAEEGWNLEAFAAALKGSPDLSAEYRDGERWLVVSRPDSSAHAYVVLADAEEDGVFDEDWPRALIPEEPFAVFAVDYRDPALAESTALRILGRAPGLVDTNFGEVVTGDEFLARTEAPGPRWEWWKRPDVRPCPRRAGQAPP